MYVNGCGVCRYAVCLLPPPPSPTGGRGNGCATLRIAGEGEGLADAAFQFQLYQPLCFDRKFHRQFLEDFFAEAVDDEADRVFFGQAALHTVENLVFADFGGGRFVFDLRRRVLHHQVGKGVGAAVATDKQGVALGEVTRARRARQDFDETPVGILRIAERDAFGDDGRFGVFADVNHFRAGIGLLVVAGEGDGVELADAVIAFEDNAGVFPSNR